MNKYLIYLWDGNEVLMHHGHDNSIKQDRYCVDSWFDLVSDYHHRYGKFTNAGWEHIPLEDFPKEFRVHLLLLGVS